jgi:hypothetical protein
MKQRDRREIVSRPARAELGVDRFLSCRIANLSRGGALILIANADWLPREFELMDIFLKTTRRVRVAWSGSTSAGVKFLDPPVKPARAAFGRRS